MLKYCLEKWDRNRGVLEEKLRTGTGFNECVYEDLVKLVVNCIFNEGDKGKGWHQDGEWDSKHITTVDNGDYQGTQLFLIPCSTYQPAEYEYLMTCVSYGSCSGCDTLQAIQTWDDGKLTEEQVKDFMALCKDLVTNTVKPFNCGWKSEERFRSLESPNDSVIERELEATRRERDRLETTVQQLRKKVALLNRFIEMQNPGNGQLVGIVEGKPLWTRTVSNKGETK